MGQIDLLPDQLLSWCGVASGDRVADVVEDNDQLIAKRIELHQPPSRSRERVKLVECLFGWC